MPDLGESDCQEVSHEAWGLARGHTNYVMSNIEIMRAEGMRLPHDWKSMGPLHWPSSRSGLWNILHTLPENYIAIDSNNIGTHFLSRFSWFKLLLTTNLHCFILECWSLWYIISDHLFHVLQLTYGGKQSGLGCCQALTPTTWKLGGIL